MDNNQNIYPVKTPARYSLHVLVLALICAVFVFIVVPNYRARWRYEKELEALHVALARGGLEFSGIKFHSSPIPKLFLHGSVKSESDLIKFRCLLLASLEVEWVDGLLRGIKIKHEESKGDI